MKRIAAIVASLVEHVAASFAAARAAFENGTGVLRRQRRHARIVIRAGDDSYGQTEATTSNGGRLGQVPLRQMEDVPVRRYKPT